MSTSRLSQTIKKLERRVGVVLFVRTSRRVELSAVGRQLYEEVQLGLGATGRAFPTPIFNSDKVAYRT